MMFTDWLLNIPIINLIYSTPLLRGPLPQFIEIFLVVFGFALVYYGGALLARRPWALVVGVILTAVLVVHLLVLTWALLTWNLDFSVVGLPDVNNLRLYIVGALLVLALVLAYGGLRLQSDENRDAYARPFEAIPSLTPTCQQCGRMLVEGKCPVHDRPAINALLVRDDTGEMFPVRSDLVYLGSGPGNTIVFRRDTKHPEYKSISADHAALTWDRGVFYLTNTSSTNPTIVNDVELTIPPGQEQSPAVPVADGSQITLGRVSLTFYVNADLYSAGEGQVASGQAWAAQAR
jgi:hypothetical protein